MLHWSLLLSSSPRINKPRANSAPCRLTSNGPSPYFVTYRSTSMHIPNIRTWLLLFLSASLLLLPCMRATVWTKPYPICASPSRWPQVQCYGDGTNTTTDGYEATVFVEAVRLGLNWTQGVDYYFNCKEITVMLGLNLDGQGALTDNITDPGLCFAGISAIGVNELRLSNGVRFSFPHYTSTLRFLTLLKISSTNDIWSFFYPFAPSLWMMIGVTGLIIPVLLIIVDVIYWFGSELNVRFNLVGFWSHFSRLLYLSIVNLMKPGPNDLQWAYETTTEIERHRNVLGEGQERVQAMPSYLLLLTFGFLTLIVCSSYTATLASFLSSSPVVATYQSMAELRGLPVGTTATYATGVLNLTQRYGVLIQTLSAFSSDGIVSNWLPMLRSGQVKALIADETVINEVYYNISIYNTCDLYRPDSKFELIAWGFAFHTNVPQSIIDDVSDGVRMMVDNGDLGRIRDSFFTLPVDPCPDRNPQTDPALTSVTPRIGVSNMSVFHNNNTLPTLPYLT